MPEPADVLGEGHLRQVNSPRATSSTLRPRCDPRGGSLRCFAETAERRQGDDVAFPAWTVGSGKLVASLLQPFQCVREGGLGGPCAVPGASAWRRRVPRPICSDISPFDRLAAISFDVGVSEGLSYKEGPHNRGMARQAPSSSHRLASSWEENEDNPMSMVSSRRRRRRTRMLISSARPGSR